MPRERVRRKMIWKIPETSVWTTGSGEKILLHEDEHKILVWNIFKASRGGIAKDLKHFAKSSEFLLLQEALQANQNNWLSGVEGFQLHMAESFQYRHNQVSTGVAIASTMPAEKVNALRASPRDFGGVWTPKSTLFSEFSFEGRPAVLISTHVLNFVMTSSFVKNLEEIAEKADQYKCPIILAGDFNTWSGTRFKILKDIMRELHLDHVEIEQDRRLLKLDHAFIRGFDVTHSRIDHEIRSSDHFPLELSVKLLK